MNEKLSLYELQLIIKDSLYMALPDMYWVIAEISEIKENYAGHCYLELIEKLPDDKNIRARVKAVAWSNRYRFLKSYFENITGESLKEGLKVLIRIKVEYHEVYGLSLIISDIDPAFTIGELAIKRQQILKRLEEDGVLTMNRDLDFPLVPHRVAVISSKNAAGYTDFIDQLTANSFGYIFYTALIDTAMQGNDTEKGVTAALDRIAANISMFDVVAIIRGGGSQTDLSWFDNYNIAYYITQFPLPVITGIGHEKDMSVTDIVAFRSLKTPTAVADFLVERMNGTENLLGEQSSEIIELSKIIIERQKQVIERTKMKLIPVAGILIAGIKEKLSSNIIELINVGREFLSEAGIIHSNQKTRLQSAAKSLISLNTSSIEQKMINLKSHSSGSFARNKVRITGLLNTLSILDPVNVLKRGYTITTLNGKILKKGNTLLKDDLIDTMFSDLSVKSRVIKKS